MTVYADVLVVVNYVVNLLLLSISGKLLGAVTSRKRLCLSAIIGALSSLSIFLPHYGLLAENFYKLLLCSLMAVIAFGLNPWQRLIKALFTMFVVSFIFAGLMAAVTFFGNPTGMLYYNGVVYFDINAVQLVFWTSIAYLILIIFERLLFSRIPDKKLYSLTVSTNGHTLVFKGLIDTGNSLKEPFSGAPVIICDKSLIKTIVPKEHERFRVIPCRTVTGNGILNSFRPDDVWITGESCNIHTADVYIAESCEPINGDYQALINPSLIHYAVK